MTQLKLKANGECNTTGEISSFQALCSLIWRSMTRARHLQSELKTCCRIAANNRPRLSPPLPNEYFGNAAEFIYVTATVGDLMGHGLGWSAMLVHQSVVAHTDGAIRVSLRAWVEKPFISKPSEFYQHGITIGREFTEVWSVWMWFWLVESSSSAKWCCEQIWRGGCNVYGERGERQCGLGDKFGTRGHGCTWVRWGVLGCGFPVSVHFSVVNLFCFVYYLCLYVLYKFVLLCWSTGNVF